MKTYTTAAGYTREIMSSETEELRARFEREFKALMGTRIGTEFFRMYESEGRTYYSYEDTRMAWEGFQAGVKSKAGSEE